ncbi:CBS domain-containing protein [Chloroflexota bacterium]
MKTILVKDVYLVHGMASALVPEGSKLEDVINTFGREPGLRAVFLVDSKQRFIGLITRIDLLKWVQHKVFGGKGDRQITAHEVFRFLFAAKAKDLARGDRDSLAVTENDSIQEALDRMIEYEETAIPVIDGQGKVLGDIRLSEVLLKALEIGKQAEQ